MSVLKLWKGRYQRWDSRGGPRRCPWGISWWELSSLDPSRQWHRLPPPGESRLTSLWCPDGGIWGRDKFVCGCGWEEFPSACTVFEWYPHTETVWSCDLIRDHVSSVAIMWAQWRSMWAQWRSCELSGDHVSSVAIMWAQWRSCDLVSNQRILHNMHACTSEVSIRTESWQLFLPPHPLAWEHWDHRCPNQRCRPGQVRQ